MYYQNDVDDTLFERLFEEHDYESGSECEENNYDRQMYTCEYLKWFLYETPYLILKLARYDLKCDVFKITTFS